MHCLSRSDCVEELEKGGNVTGNEIKKMNRRKAIRQPSPNL